MDIHDLAGSEAYGPWALVAGGAQGIGEAFARFAAAQGINVAVIDNNGAALSALLPALEAGHGVETLGLELDLSAPDLLERVTAGLGNRDIGLLVYNAAVADVGPFFKPGGSLDFELKRLAVNVTGPLVLTYHFGQSMLRRGAGGIVLMSSGAGLQGAPYYAHYSATKAYEMVLAQALWAEFAPYDVHVLACVAGMTLSTAAEGYAHLDTSGFQTPAELVDEAMAALGKQSTLIAGADNRKNLELLGQLPLDQRIEILARHPVEHFLGGEVPDQHIPPPPGRKTPG
jgi:short-subunit dehydrogenase